ncbi:MAG: M12 family metallo-peptidase [Hyphomicrobiaceae bacterium]
MTFLRYIYAVPMFGSFAWLTTSPVVGQEHVFREAPAEMRLTDSQASMLARARGSSAATGVSIRRLRPHSDLQAALAGASEGITLELSDATVLKASRTGVNASAGAGVWRGRVDATGGQVTLIWWADGRMAGTVQNDGRYYLIRPMGGGLHAVLELNENLMPPEHQPQMLVASNERFGQSNGALALRSVTAGMTDAAKRQATPKAGSSGSARGTSSGAPADVNIDVMVAYTKKSAGHYGDIASELIELAIEEANESFRISNLGYIKLRLVHTYETDYIEEGTHLDHVWRLADKGDGHMEEAHELRDRHRADVVILIVDDSQGCGLATRVHAEANEAFAVVHHECAATTHSVAHEIGHIIGARHDLSMDSIMTPFPYGHGYVNGTKWRDIMSYKGSCGGCPRVPVWSSPSVLVRGEPAGTPELHNARVIAEEAARVAAFR